MQRDYTTGYKEDVKVFSGLEIEHTLAYGKQTLFLARNDLTFDQIISLAVSSDAEAIYFGANRTYMHNHAMQVAQIHQLLDRGYWVTVDYPYELHRLVSKKFATCWTDEKFIPFCSIIFPFTEDDKPLHRKAGGWLWVGDLYRRYESYFEESARCLHRIQARGY